MRIQPNPSLDTSGPFLPRAIFVIVVIVVIVAILLTTQRSAVVTLSGFRLWLKLVAWVAQGEGGWVF